MSSQSKSGTLYARLHLIQQNGNSNDQQPYVNLLYKFYGPIVISSLIRHKILKSRINAGRIETKLLPSSTTMIPQEKTLNSKLLPASI